MRLTAQARIYLPGEEVFREPGFFDKVRHFLGSDVDLRTGELALTREALLLTEQIRAALGKAGIHNAVTLVVDDDVVFSDTEGIPNDPYLLVRAMRDAAARFQRGFDKLRAVFEHGEAGIETLLEVTVERVHRKEDPSATFAFGSRIKQLRPQPGESIEFARERIGKLLGDQNVVLTAQTALSDLVARVERGCLEAFPRGIVEADPAEVSLRKPGVDDVQAMMSGFDAATDRQPALGSDFRWINASSVYYDPWLVYYNDPVDTWATLHVLHAMTNPAPSWGYGAGALGDRWNSAGVPLPVMNAKGDALTEGRYVGDPGQASYFSGVDAVADLDFDTGLWEDESLELYKIGEEASGSWDCTASTLASSDSSSTSSWDCSSDCSSDCSYDCSWDCSSDCSWDCSSDCSGWD